MPRVALLCMLTLLVTACDTAERRAQQEALINGPRTPSSEVPPAPAPPPQSSSNGQPSEASATAPAVPRQETAAANDLAIPRDYRIRPLPEPANPDWVTCRPDISAEQCAEGQAALARDADEIIADGRKQCERLNRFQAEASRALASGTATVDGIGLDELPDSITRARNFIEANCL